MFSDNAPSANPVFFRTYSRRTESGLRESWEEVCDRTANGTSAIGKFTEEEWALIDKYQRELKTLSSGRWLWVGGTKWIDDPLNVYGGYNCSGTAITDWAAFGLLMNLAMCGSGTGAGLEEKFISQLPIIRNKLTVEIMGDQTPPFQALPVAAPCAAASSAFSIRVSTPMSRANRPHSAQV